MQGIKYGDLISLARNVNYFDYVYAVYLGEPIRPVKMENCHAGLRFFYRPLIGTYQVVHGVEAAKHYPIEELQVYYPSGASIPAFPKPLRRLGHVIVKSDDYYGLCRMLEAIDHHITFAA